MLNTTRVLERIQRKMEEVFSEMSPFQNKEDEKKIMEDRQALSHAIQVLKRVEDVEEMANLLKNELYIATFMDRRNQTREKFRLYIRNRAQLISNYLKGGRYEANINTAFMSYDEWV